MQVTERTDATGQSFIRLIKLACPVQSHQPSQPVGPDGAVEADLARAIPVLNTNIGYGGGCCCRCNYAHVATPWSRANSSPMPTAQMIMEISRRVVLTTCLLFSVRCKFHETAKFSAHGQCRLFKVQFHTQNIQFLKYPCCSTWQVWWYITINNTLIDLIFSQSASSNFIFMSFGKVRCTSTYDCRYVLNYSFLLLSNSNSIKK